MTWQHAITSLIAWWECCAEERRRRDRETRRRAVRMAVSNGEIHK